MEEAKALRQFHNDVKFQLLSKYCKNTPILLDIGCGRGGDIHKWNRLNIHSVTAIDINKAFILEAIRRYNQQAFPLNINYKFFYTYECNVFQDFFKMKDLPVHNTYDIVSCMFAFHYFWKNEFSLNKILQQISSSLKPGGYFIGVCPDGDIIHNLLSDYKSIKNNAVLINKKYQHTTKVIGNAIEFMLSGTLYFGENMISEEYLVYKDIFRETCEKYGLKLIEFTEFSKYYEKQDKISMLQDSKYASFLNMSFVFQKQLIT